jgi:hypothetical protein
MNEHRAFFKNYPMGGGWGNLQQGTIVGDKKFGVHGIVCCRVLVFLYFFTPRTTIRAFSETDFWMYSVTLCSK